MNQHSILHVEDDDDDFFFVQRAAKTIGLTCKITRACDGQEALDYLSGEGSFSNRKEFPIPSLVLLDMKLPRMMGMEVLRWIRANPELRSLVVIVFSSSPVTNDVDNAYDLGVNSFLVKPSGMDKFEHVLRLIRDYWLKVSELPSVSHSPEGPGKKAVHRFPNLER